MRRVPLLTAALLLAALSAAAQEGGTPLSAIDWLSRSVEGAPVGARPSPEPPVAGDASAPGVVVTPLDGAGAAGLLPAEVTGLPPTLWSGSDPAAIRALLGADHGDVPPALRDLLVTLMLAEADPPPGEDAGAFLLARVDKLLAMGALEPAQALLEAGDLTAPEAFRRWFDVTLLTGTEAAACATLREHPRLAPTLPARVFCTARNGDWPAAALTLATARALGDVTADEEALLTLFLDPEAQEGEPDLRPAARPTPLEFRMREAVGIVTPTAGLPLAFAHADLRPTVAWRAQIEAAERLARNGALSENVLQAAYTARRPAASGGVWDRAAAVQALDAALLSGDEAAISAALHPAWGLMREARLAVPFARLYAPRLAGRALDAGAAAVAFRLGLLSPAYGEAAAARTPATPEERAWIAVATGQPADGPPADPRAAAILAGFGEVDLPPDLAEPLAAGRLGEAALRAVAAFGAAGDGDLAGATTALASLRAMGLDEVARSAALQALVLGDDA